MKTFASLYLLFLLLLFGLLYWDPSPLAASVDHYQRGMTLYFLELGLPKGQLRGIDIWINPHYKIIITKACNGMIPILVLWAAVLAYPLAGWGRKLLWLLIGYLVLSAVNILRLLMVAACVKEQADFPFCHDLLGNMLLMLAGLLLFWLFLRGTRAQRLMR